MTNRQFSGWHSASDGQGTCVEVGTADDHTIGVRDSKDPTGPIVEFTPSDWRSFITEIRNNSFDR